MAARCGTFLSSTRNLKIAAIVLCVASLLQIIGFSTRYWSVYHLFGIEANYGLWERCICEGSLGCECESYGIGSHNGYLNSVRTSESVGLGAILLTSLLILIQLFLSPSYYLKIFILAFDLVAAVSILVGIAIFAGYQGRRVHYSFGLCIAAAILCFVAFAFLVKDRKNNLEYSQNANTGIETPNTVVYNSQHTAEVPDPTQQKHGSYGAQQAVPPQSQQAPPYTAEIFKPNYAGNTDIPIQDKKY